MAKKTKPKEKPTVGTDYRTDGFYNIPPNVRPLPEGFDANQSYVSVTTALDFVTNFERQKAWWICEEVFELAQAAKERQTAKVYVEKNDVGTVDVSPAKLLLNDLPESYGVNFGKHWVAKAGDRELARRANRGTVIHRALLDYALYDMRVSPSDVEDYTGAILDELGFVMPASYCSGRVALLIRWLDKHLGNIELCEAPVFNAEYEYAGTLDLIATLRGIEGHSDSTRWLIDAKGSTFRAWTHKVQLAAYRRASHVMVAAAGCFMEMPQVDAVANIYCEEDKVVLHRWDTDALALEDAFNAFTYILAAFWIKARTECDSGEVVGGATLRAVEKPAKKSKPLPGERVRSSRYIRG